MITFFRVEAIDHVADKLEDLAVSSVDTVTSVLTTQNSERSSDDKTTYEQDTPNGCDPFRAKGVVRAIPFAFRQATKDRAPTTAAAASTRHQEQYPYEESHDSDDNREEDLDTR